MVKSIEHYLTMSTRQMVTLCNVRQSSNLKKERVKSGGLVKGKDRGGDKEEIEQLQQLQEQEHGGDEGTQDENGAKENKGEDRVMVMEGEQRDAIKGDGVGVEEGGEEVRSDGGNNEGDDGQMGEIRVIGERWGKGGDDEVGGDDGEGGNGGKGTEEGTTGNEDWDLRGNDMVFKIDTVNPSLVERLTGERDTDMGGGRGEIEGGAGEMEGDEEEIKKRDSTTTSLHYNVCEEDETRLFSTTGGTDGVGGGGKDGEQGWFGYFLLKHNHGGRENTTAKDEGGGRETDGERGFNGIVGVGCFVRYLESKGVRNATIESMAAGGDGNVRIKVIADKGGGKETREGF